MLYLICDNYRNKKRFKDLGRGREREREREGGRGGRGLNYSSGIIVQDA
jgi:ribosomal protein L15